MKDVTALFGDMAENYPGSRHKRRAVASPVPHSAEEEERWDSRPIVRKLNGIDTEFFLIGALALALHRKPVTIRRWLTEGILPQERYRITSTTGVRGSRRLWTRAQVDGIVRIAQEEGLLSPVRVAVSTTEFTSRVKELFRVLKEEET